MTTLPWTPLFTTTRSGLPEVTVHGVISVWDPALGLLINAGDITAPLWMRSLLKPWQLLVIMPSLLEKHPDITSEHLAIMMASQQGDKQQLELLAELLEKGGLKNTDLECPAALPLGLKKIPADTTPSPVFHPCSGKHTAYLLAGKNPDDYLDATQPEYLALKNLLGELLEKNNTGHHNTQHYKEPLPESTDGCGMPNYAVSAEEMSRLYWLLTKDVALEGYNSFWNRLGETMRNHPLIVGGEGRLDSRLMLGDVIDGAGFIAKEGADGLLGIGVMPHQKYPAGLGILIKLAHGYYPEHLELVLDEVLTQLGLKPSRVLPFRQVVKTQFHFSVNKHARII